MKTVRPNLFRLKNLPKTIPQPLLAIFILVAAANSCTPVQGDPAGDMIGRDEAYQTALYDAITPTGASNDVVMWGVISQIGLGCEAGEGSCFLNLRRGDLIVQVFYHGSSNDINTCPNKEPGSQVANLVHGDRIEIYGKQTNPGTIYLCDSQDYFIRKIQSTEITPDP